MIKKTMAIVLILLSTICFATENERKMNSSERPTIQYVVFHKPGPKWQKGVDFRQQPGVEDHVAHYMKLYNDGRLAMGGPFLDNTGGMMIAALGETQDSLSKFAAEDPAVKSGLLTFEVKPWFVAMKKEK
jgi:uncharacterized protein YciI